MEFMNRGFRPAQPANTGNPSGPEPGAQHTGRTNKSGMGGVRGLRIFSVVLFFSVAILLIALATSFVYGPSGGGESKLVDKSRYQAVFINGGQVYFGRITSLNSQYVQLDDIFYLRLSQQVQPPDKASSQANDPILVPLGCELHRPTSAMVINREQIIFWENLKDETGENTVPGAIKKHKAANPQGQECAQPAAEQPKTDTIPNN